MLPQVTDERHLRTAIHSRGQRIKAMSAWPRRLLRRTESLPLAAEHLSEE
ncbi:hypothetical protein [Eisenbergiella sp.]